MQTSGYMIKLDRNSVMNINEMKIMNEMFKQLNMTRF